MRSVAATLSCNDFASCSGVDLTGCAGGAAFFLFDNGLSNRLIMLPIASDLSILFLTVPRASTIFRACSEVKTRFDFLPPLSADLPQIVFNALSIVAILILYMSGQVWQTVSFLFVLSRDPSLNSAHGKTERLRVRFSNKRQSVGDGANLSLHRAFSPLR